MWLCSGLCLARMATRGTVEGVVDYGYRNREEHNHEDYEYQSKYDTDYYEDEFDSFHKQTEANAIAMRQRYDRNGEYVHPIERIFKPYDQSLNDQIYNIPRAGVKKSYDEDQPRPRYIKDILVENYLQTIENNTNENSVTIPDHHQQLPTDGEEKRPHEAKLKYDEMYWRYMRGRNWVEEQGHPSSNEENVSRRRQDSGRIKYDYGPRFDEMYWKYIRNILDKVVW